MNSEVVLVTGGQGFLGQHIIRLLQEKDDRVNEIRVIDIKPFSKRLEYKENKPVKSYICDIAKDGDEKLASLFKGVDCVIHAAGLSGFGRYPPLKEMEKVNIHGTHNVIHACVKAGVGRLVYTSTAELCLPRQKFVPRAREAINTVPPKSGFLLNDYCTTKFQAERLVIEAHGKELPNGNTLKTVCIRPTLLYGELDPYYVTNALSVANKCGGTLYRIGREGAHLQVTYAGNAAWAHIVAKDELRDSPDEVGKKTFFITDDTEETDTFTFVEPFLESRKMSLSSLRYPFFLAYIFVWIMFTISKIVKPLDKFTRIFPEPSTLTYICNIYHFSRMRAALSLRYKPIYTPEEAHKNSMHFYSTVHL